MNATTAARRRSPSCRPRSAARPRALRRGAPAGGACCRARPAGNRRRLRRPRRRPPSRRRRPPPPDAHPTPSPPPAPDPFPKPPLPPAGDPADVAPDPGTTVATSVAGGAGFLFKGADPIQKEVDAGTIEPKRIAVLRGRVLKPGPNPAGPPVAMSGARVTILDHPELGYTSTRADGGYDLAVNGGEELVLHVEQDGFASVQRTEDVPWQDYVDVEDVVMTPYSPKVMQVDENAATLQAVTSDQVSDADGARKATLMFEPGTDATMTLPDGTVQPLGDLDVRATEYTVGARGDEAMPGDLPASSAYTYAVEFSVDQAVEAGATDVRFTKPVATYVENFLGFAAGTLVPAAYYDEAEGEWVPSANGVVIKRAEGGVDVTGDGHKDDPAGSAMTKWGIDAAEVAKLAAQYPDGKSLWRVEVRHFTPWDYNWPYGCKADCDPPRLDPPPPAFCPECQASGLDRRRVQPDARRAPAGRRHAVLAALRVRPRARLQGGLPAEDPAHRAHDPAAAAQRRARGDRRRQDARALVHRAHAEHELRLRVGRQGRLRPRARRRPDRARARRLRLPGRVPRAGGVRRRVRAVRRRATHAPEPRRLRRGAARGHRLAGVGAADRRPRRRLGRARRLDARRPPQLRPAVAHALHRRRHDGHRRGDPLGDPHGARQGAVLAVGRRHAGDPRHARARARRRRRRRRQRVRRRRPRRARLPGQARRRPAGRRRRPGRRRRHRRRRSRPPGHAALARRRRRRPRRQPLHLRHRQRPRAARRPRRDDQHVRRRRRRRHARRRRAGDGRVAQAPARARARRRRHALRRRGGPRPGAPDLARRADLDRRRRRERARRRRAAPSRPRWRTRPTSRSTRTARSTSPTRATTGSARSPPPASSTRSPATASPARPATAAARPRRRSASRSGSTSAATARSTSPTACTTWSGASTAPGSSARSPAPATAAVAATAAPRSGPTCRSPRTSRSRPTAPC